MPKPFKMTRVSHDGSVTRSFKHASELIHIQGMVNGSHMKMMIDTGSTISAVDASYAKTLRLRPHTQSISTSCRTANNGLLQVLGTVTVPITIHSLPLQMEAFVIDNLCMEVLLGGDFCNKYQVHIDYESRCLSLRMNRQHVVVNLCQHPSSEQVFNVTTIDDVLVPPLSARIVQARTSAPSMAAIFSPSSELINERHIFAPHALVKINSDKLTTLSVLNSTSSPIVIPRKTLSG